MRLWRNSNTIIACKARPSSVVFIHRKCRGAYEGSSIFQGRGQAQTFGVIRVISIVTLLITLLMNLQLGLG